MLCTRALLILIFTSTFALAAEEAKPKVERPETWAQPVKKAGLPNLHKVSDSLYRSAQPTKEGFKEIEKLGVRTVINLRSFHSDRKLIKGTELKYEHITMKAWHPENKEIIRFLKTVTDPKQAPVLVHCQHGADRTGTMVAVYRIVVQDWTKEEAIREMREGGFGYHEVFVNLIAWIQALDVEKVRKEAGIAPSAKPDKEAEGDKGP